MPLEPRRNPARYSAFENPTLFTIKTEDPLVAFRMLYEIAQKRSDPEYAPPKLQPLTFAFKYTESKKSVDDTTVSTAQFRVELHKLPNPYMFAVSVYMCSGTSLELEKIKAEILKEFKDRLAQ